MRTKFLTTGLLLLSTLTACKDNPPQATPPPAPRVAPGEAEPAPTPRKVRPRNPMPA